MISCIPLFGSLLNGAVTPGMYNKYIGEDGDTANGFGAAHLIGFFLQVASLLMVIAIFMLDAYAEKTDKMILK